MLLSNLHKINNNVNIINKLFTNNHIFIDQSKEVYLKNNNEINNLDNINEEIMKKPETIDLVDSDKDDTISEKEEEK